MSQNRVIFTQDDDFIRLHAAGIEIVSPNFMNTRAVADNKLFIPKPVPKVVKEEQTQAEDVAFDKAEEAASVEEIRKAIEIVDAELLVLEKEEGDEIILSKDRLKEKKSLLIEQLKAAEEQRKAAELAEQTGTGK